MTHYSMFATAIGDCGIAWNSELVVATQLPETTSEVAAARLSRRFQSTLGEPPVFIQKAIESIKGLLAGEKCDLTNIKCDFSGIESFAVKVYQIARTIPVGETQTYGDIAAELGDKQLSQAVGRALGRNPLPIIVPCHRVIGANGKLTGFSAHGGIETKVKMLRIEGAQAAGSLGLFDPL